MTAMESTFEQKLDDTMKIPDVKGVICSDSSGLCISYRGQVSQSLAGPIAALCDEPNKQWPSQDSPVIVLETGENASGTKSTLMVKVNDGISTGILKEERN